MIVCEVYGVSVSRCCVAVTYLLTDGAGMQGLMSKCPFMQNTMCSESGREEAVDIAVTAEAVLCGIVFQLNTVRRCCVL